MSNPTHSFILIKQKLYAIRERVNRDLNALEAEIESWLPDEGNVKRRGPDPSDVLQKLVDEKRKQSEAR